MTDRLDNWQRDWIHIWDKFLAHHWDYPQQNWTDIFSLPPSKHTHTHTYTHLHAHTHWQVAHSCSLENTHSVLALESERATETYKLLSNTVTHTLSLSPPLSLSCVWYRYSDTHKGERVPYSSRTNTYQVYDDPPPSKPLGTLPAIDLLHTPFLSFHNYSPDFCRKGNKKVQITFFDILLSICSKWLYWKLYVVINIYLLVVV